MQVLIADDDAVSRRLLKATLQSWGHEDVSCADGHDALARLSEPGGAPMTILDWMMPGLDGPSVCRRLRDAGVPNQPRYLVLLTSLAEREEIVAGLGAGADDYVTKPFHQGELRARLTVGERVVALQTALAGRVGELEEALAQIKQLHGLLPICAYCNEDTKRPELLGRGRGLSRSAHGRALQSRRLSRLLCARGRRARP